MKFSKIAHWLILFLFAAFPKAFADDGADFRAELSDAKTSPDSSGIYVLLSSAFLNNDRQKAALLADSAVACAERSGIDSVIVEARHQSGVAAFYVSDYRKALEMFEFCYEAYEKLGKESDAARSVMNIGVAAKKLGKLDLAFKYYRESLKFFEGKTDVKSSETKALLFNNLGMIYYNWGEHNKALENFQKSAEISEEHEFKSALASALNNIALIYEATLDEEEALKYYRMSYDIKHETGNKLGLVNSLNNIGLTHNTLGNIDSAKYYLDAAESLAKEIDNPQGLGLCYSIKGAFYSDRKDFDKALIYLNLAKNIYSGIESELNLADVDLQLAIVHYEKGDLRAARKIFEGVPESEINKNRKSSLIEANKYLIKIYDKTGNFKKGFERAKDLIELKDSVFTEENSANLAKQKVLHEIDLKDKTIALKEEALQYKDQLNARQRIIIIGGLIFIFFFAIAVVWIYLKYRTNSKLNKKLKKRNKEIDTKNEELESALKSLEQSQERILRDSKTLVELNMKLSDSEAELKELNATKDKFFSIISHDLRNPIGSFKNAVGQLSENYDIFDDKDRREIIEMLADSSENVYQLLDNLLNWSRSQTGKLKPNPSFFNISFAVGQTISALNQHASDKKITIEKHVDPDLEVEADVNFIQTIIRNLTSNAIKFTPENGKIKLTVKAVGGSAFIEVSDTGVGMDKEKLRNLFRIDGRNSSQGTKGETGAGLGLLLTKELVEKSEGSISARSEPGKGTTFSVKIPLVAR